MILETIPALAQDLVHLKMRLARNPIVHKMEALPADDRSVLRYFVDLMLPEEYLSETYLRRIALEASERPARSIGGNLLLDAAYFYLEDSLDKALRYNAPSFGQATITECPLTTTPYRLIERRQPDNTEVELPVEYALKAGLSYEDFARYRNNFFDSYLATTHRFLTWQPNDKLVDNTQQEYLYFLTNFTPLPQKLILWTKVDFADGTSTIVDRLEKDNIRPFQVYKMPAGYTELNLASLEKTVKKWSVFLTNEANERISELRTYHIDRRYRRNVQYFIFNNSLGGFDTIRFTGSRSETLTMSREVIENYLKDDYSPSDFETSVNSLEGEESVTVFTGILKSAYKQYLQELFLAKEMYRVSEGELISVRLDAKDWIPVSPDASASETGARLRFVANHKVRNYSRMPVLPPAPELYFNLTITGQVQKNNCDSGQVGSFVTITVPAGTFSSADSQQDAQAQAQAWFDANKQALANEQGSCQLPTYYNTAISGQVQRNNCEGGVGSTVTFTIAAGTFSSNISQAAAQAAAQAAFDAQKQDYANANGVCSVIYAKGEKRNYQVSYPDQNGGIDATWDYYVVFRDSGGNLLNVTDISLQIRDYGQTGSGPFDSENPMGPFSGTEALIGSGYQTSSYDDNGDLLFNYYEEFQLKPGTGYTVAP